jgi:hypothetical protein
VPDLLGIGGVSLLVLTLALEAVLTQGLQILRVGDSAPLVRRLWMTRSAGMLAEAAALRKRPTSAAVGGLDRRRYRRP